jgi:hypothetical protein
MSNHAGKSRGIVGNRIVPSEKVPGEASRTAAGNEYQVLTTRCLRTVIRFASCLDQIEEMRDVES